MTYKLKHKPPHISRLSKYKGYPPPMTDEPALSKVPYLRSRNWRSWKHRCEVLYQWAMQGKQGTRPVNPAVQQGLWMHRENTQ